MNTKLTLSLDQRIIEKVKTYAKIHKISLSKMVENYFRIIIKKPNIEIKSSAIVDELSGIIDLPVDFNENEEYYKYLVEKYK